MTPDDFADRIDMQAKAVKMAIESSHSDPYICISNFIGFTSNILDYLCRQHPSILEECVEKMSPEIKLFLLIMINNLSKIQKEDANRIHDYP